MQAARGTPLREGSHMKNGRKTLLGISLVLILLLGMFTGCAGKGTPKNPAANSSQTLVIVDVSKPESQIADSSAAETSTAPESREEASQAAESFAEGQTPAAESSAEAQTPAAESSAEDQTPAAESSKEPGGEEQKVREDGTYTSVEEVALYIHLYGHLPSNFITKAEAEKLGWVSSRGNLWKVTDHKSIGGDRFGNYEGLLPKKKGRQYYECDVNYNGGYRGSERIIYSNDGLVYYTNDHYKTFTKLYGEG